MFASDKKFEKIYIVYSQLTFKIASYKHTVKE